MFQTTEMTTTIGKAFCTKCAQHLPALTTLQAEEAHLEQLWHKDWEFIPAQWYFQRTQTQIFYSVFIGWISKSGLSPSCFSPNHFQMVCQNLILWESHCFQWLLDHQKGFCGTEWSTSSFSIREAHNFFLSWDTKKEWSWGEYFCWFF